MTTIKVQRAPARSMQAASAFEREVDRFLTQPPGLFQFPLGRLFPPVFSFASPTKTFGWLPTAEMTETKDQYIITAELPGLKKENVDIEFDDGILTISGEKKEEEKQEEARYYTFERAYGYFERAFAFAAPVKADKIVATVTDGVLKVMVPKAEMPKVEVKKIPVIEGK